MLPSDPCTGPAPAVAGRGAPLGAHLAGATALRCRRHGLSREATASETGRFATSPPRPAPAHHSRGTSAGTGTQRYTPRRGRSRSRPIARTGDFVPSPGGFAAECGPPVSTEAVRAPASTSTLDPGGRGWSPPPFAPCNTTVPAISCIQRPSTAHPPACHRAARRESRRGNAAVAGRSGDRDPSGTAGTGPQAPGIAAKMARATACVFVH
jgi:hypothetical protein